MIALVIALLASEPALTRTMPDQAAALRQVAAGRHETLMNSSPSAVLDLGSDAGPRRTVVTFHRVWAGDQARPSWTGEWTWIARLRDARGGKLTTGYADRRDCPALGQVLSRAEAIPTPAFDFDDVADGEPSRTPFLQFHGVEYSFSGPGMFPGADREVLVELTGGEGSPLSHWAEESLRALKPCWTDKLPPCRSWQCGFVRGGSPKAE